MALPNFLVVGGQKCGSTSFARQIAEHPEVFMSPIKEPHFFSYEDQWKRGLGWYESLFQESGGAKAIGEASTSYTAHPACPGVPARIAALLPNVRLIYLVRNPIERMISHYLHMWYDGIIAEEFEKAVASIPQLVDYGRYYWQVEQYLPYFPRERWLILIFEEFVADPLRAHRQICQFLDIDTGFVPSNCAPANVTSRKGRRLALVRWAMDNPVVSKIGSTLLPLRVRDWLRWLGPKREKPEVSPVLRDRLLERFLPDVEALSQFVGRDLKAIWDMDRR